MPAEYELNDADYALFVEALHFKCVEEGKDVNDVEQVLGVMKDWWLILQDKPSVQAYVTAMKIAALQAEKAADEARIVEIDAEIAQLQS